jgi:hypothetical protein
LEVLFAGVIFLFHTAGTRRSEFPKSGFGGFFQERIFFAHGGKAAGNGANSKAGGGTSISKHERSLPKPPKPKSRGFGGFGGAFKERDFFAGGRGCV